MIFKRDASSCVPSRDVEPSNHHHRRGDRKFDHFFWGPWEEQNKNKNKKGRRAKLNCKRQKKHNDLFYQLADDHQTKINEGRKRKTI